jgi:hypothetical protein
MLTTEKQNGMDSIFKKLLDRINRIYRIFFDHFPEENGQTTCARGAHVASGEVINTRIFVIGITIPGNHCILLRSFFCRRRMEFS